MRARILRPGFFYSEQLLSCTPAARLLFPGLWCLADREGRLEDRPAQIKLLVFPNDRFKVNSLLEELTSAELIIRYEADSKRCIWIPKFVENQNPHPHEAASVLPACNYISPESPTKADVITSQGESGRVRQTQESIQASVQIQNSGSDGQGTRLPTDFTLTPDLEQFAKDSGLDPLGVLGAFRDYWAGVPGAKGRKSDWPGTFRNWCRRESTTSGSQGFSRNASRNGSGVQLASDFLRKLKEGAAQQ